ncbi:hypothetical protein T265_14861, partial [Opisthorchis viverrini]
MSMTGDSVWFRRIPGLPDRLLFIEDDNDINDDNANSELFHVHLFLGLEVSDQSERRLLDELDESICVRLGFIDEIPDYEDEQADDQPTKMEDIGTVA